MKKILSGLFLIVFALHLQAQNTNAEIKIKTSAICETCKETIEHELSFAKGIKMVKLDLETKEVSVSYNPSKTTETKIREALSKIGYDADSIKADPKAFRKLPECCQAPGHH